MKKFNEKLSKFCKEKNNRLCLGLDVDNSKLKNSSLKYLKDYIVDIIDSTIDLCPIYKVNFAIFLRNSLVFIFFANFNFFGTF